MTRVASLGPILLALMVWPCADARAQLPAVSDTQLWLQAQAQLPVGDAWTVHAEAQTRWLDDVSEYDQTMWRGALGRGLGSRVTVWAGYAYNPRWVAGVRLDEQRTWQQMSATLPRMGRWTSSIRIRPEQRYLPEWGDASHRLRMLGRLLRPIGASPWSVALSNEYFVTMDETRGGPHQGFDQNRFFAGAVRKLSADLLLEVGYLWQWQSSTAVRGTRHGHTLIGGLTYAPTR